MRARVAFPALAFLSAACSGAGSQPGPCNPDTCAGCCAGDACVPGDLPEECGAGGEACIACEAALICAGGSCRAESARCNPGTCAGCCAGDSCLPGDLAEECGSGGQACRTCASGMSCAAGRCQSEPVGCSPESCSGCCAGDACRPGNLPAACGARGAPCVACRAGTSCSAGSCQAPPPDPCRGVPTAGRCAGERTIEICSTTGGSPRPVTLDCGDGHRCAMVEGRAACQRVAECLPNELRCRGASQIDVCESLRWVTYGCPGGCASGALGDYCRPAVPVHEWTVRVTYQARGVNDSRRPTDWGAPFEATAQGFVVASIRSTATAEQWFDVGVTSEGEDDGGVVTLRVPDAPEPDDRIVILAIGTEIDGRGQPRITFAVADPGLAPGAHATRSSPGPTAQPWGWSGNTAELAGRDQIAIHVTAGAEIVAGAARVFDYLRHVYGSSADRYSDVPSGPIVVWLGADVSWDCGACAAPWPVAVGGTAYASQVWMPGGAVDQGYWADPVTAHELGHWVMSEFGRSPNEGGCHVVGHPVPPGMAWSEGWATWYSSDVRGSPLYYAKTNGSFFWLDLGEREGSLYGELRRPNPGDPAGVLQPLDENLVSAMLWSLSAIQAHGHAPLDAALRAPRMRTPPFGRGYCRHIWDPSGDECVPYLHVRATSEPAPTLPDFFDTLVCGGLPAADIEAAVGPDYPYPGTMPGCR